MNTCLCCRGALLYQISRRRIYWFCPNCRQEIPIQIANRNQNLTQLKE